MKTDWDVLQDNAFDRLMLAVRSKTKAICATGPTGFGKTVIAERLISWANAEGIPWIFYTHRKLLFSQTHKRFLSSGLTHGCRASGWQDYESLDHPGQMAMFPSELHAVKLGKKRKLHKAGLVLIDEAHACSSGFPEEVIRYHLRECATVVGLTATPVGVGHIYKQLVVLSTNGQLRQAGGILPAVTYSPDEVDLKGVGKLGSGEFSAKDLGPRFTVSRVFGSILEHYNQYNPEQKPAMLFAPGVSEAIWFADQFRAAGIEAASVDGENVYAFGMLSLSNAERRDEVQEAFRTGHIKVLCNRFVYREGVDIPEVAHGIFATSFGTEEGWVQAGGRILRSHPSLKNVVIQDHGGNWHRFGSLNQDRIFGLNDTSISRVKEVQKAKESGEAKQDKSCPSCSRVIFWAHWMQNGKACPYCSFKFDKTRRQVVQIDGSLKAVDGDPVGIVRKVIAPAQKLWDSVYFPSRNSKSNNARNFNQLRAAFHRRYPRYHIDLSPTNQVTEIVDRETGTRSLLGYVPPPGSMLWKQRATEVQYDELQYPERKQT
jgi:superfamily II DNA or RNA helicase